MNKKRLKIALTVSNAIKSRFREAQGFIDSNLREECEREKVAADEVSFLLVNLQKKCLDKHKHVLDLAL